MLRDPNRRPQELAESSDDVVFDQVTVHDWDHIVLVRLERRSGNPREVVVHGVSLVSQNQAPAHQG